MGLLSSLGSIGGAALGTALGGPVGTVVGGYLGGKAGSLIGGLAGGGSSGAPSQAAPGIASAARFVTGTPSTAAEPLDGQATASATCRCAQK